MSELKGMVVFAVSEPCEDGSFFIRKSIRDGSLAIFDENSDAEKQLARNDIDGDAVNECLLVRAERAKNVNDELKALTETLRLKELENQQLAQDKVELVEALDSLLGMGSDGIDNYRITVECEKLLEKHK